MILSYWIVRRDGQASDALVSGHLHVATIEAAIRHVRSLPLPAGTSPDELEIILHRGHSEIWRGPYDPGGG